MSSIQTLTPNNAQNLNAANWSYSQGSAALPAGFRYLMDGGQPVTLYNASTGFYGAALVASTGQVMVTFEGTNFFTGSAEFTAAQVLDDAAITAGIDAPSYQTALNFTQSAVTDAEAQGYNASDIYLDGHSLGGADVEYVASQLGIPGTTFGAPGIPAGDIPSGATQDLTNYVEYGDPVGNYAQGGYEGNIVQSDNIVHYGTVDWTGSYLGIVPLTTAAVAYDAGDYSAAIAALAVALPFHLLGTYAESLGVPPLANGDLSSGALGDGEAAAAAIFSSLFKSGAAGTSGTSPGATNNSQTLSQTGSAATSSGDVFGGDFWCHDHRRRRPAPLRGRHWRGLGYGRLGQYDDVRRDQRREFGPYRGIGQQYPGWRDGRIDFDRWHGQCAGIHRRRRSSAPRRRGWRLGDQWYGRQRR